MAFASKVAAILSIGLFSGTAVAAEQWELVDATYAQLTKEMPIDKGIPHQTLAWSLYPNTLQMISAHTDNNDMRHTRFQQYYSGFPVLGAVAIVHTPSLGRPLIRTSHSPQMNGVVYRNITQELGLPPDAFLERGKEALRQMQLAYAGEIIDKEEITPMVYIDEQHVSHWAYQLSFLVHATPMPLRPSAIVDAYTYQPFVEWNDIKTLTPVKAEGYGGNERYNKVHYGVDKSFLNILRDANSGTCFLANENVMIWDMESAKGDNGHSISFQCKDNAAASYWTGANQDGYDRANGGYSPSNDALYIGSHIYEMYQKWYGMGALGLPYVQEDGSIYEAPSPLKMRVHYGELYENAFWDGEQISFGDGGNSMYPMVGMTVTAHEIAHGLTQRYSNLIYFGESGGLNESFSDMAAQALEYYLTGKNSWKIGTEVIKESASRQAIRYMETPSLDGRSIERIQQFHPGMEVHYSSGVYNRFFYLLANSPGMNTRDAYKIMLDANMKYWTLFGTFEANACGIVWAARDLEIPRKTLFPMFDEIGIDARLCH